MSGWADAIASVKTTNEDAVKAPAADEGADDGGDVEAEVKAHFEPVVKGLQIVHVATGEEDEDCLYKQRSKVYRFNTKEGEWKERGTGDVKILQHKETQGCRVILRQEKTGKLVLNHQVPSDVNLQANMGSDRAWTWVAKDYSDPEPTIWTFAMKFKTPEVANEFKVALEKARDLNKGKGGAGPASPQKAEAKEEKSVWLQTLEGRTIKHTSAEVLKKEWNAVDSDQKNGVDKAGATKILTAVIHAVFTDSGVPAGAIKDVEASLGKLVDRVFEHAEGKLKFDDFVQLPEIRVCLP